MTITDYVQNTMDSLGFIPDDSLQIAVKYLNGLIRAHKKSVSSIIEELDTKITIKNFLKNLKDLENFHPQFNHYKFQQIRSSLDGRSRILLLGDDTTHQVYGNKIFGASYQYDHTLSTSINSIKLVDITVADTKDRVLLNDFDVYLPESFLKGLFKFRYAFRTKIQILLSMICEIVGRFKDTTISKNSIWVLVDSWYVSGKFVTVLQDLGINYVLQLKKGRKIRLFDTWMKVETYFESYKKEHYFTYKKENRKVYCKKAILDVSKIGRRKVFRFKEENVEGYRYFITNDLKLTAKTAYAYIKKRWKVETMHRELKQFFGLKYTYSGRKDYLLAHYIVSYYGWLLFQWYKWQEIEGNKNSSTEALWKEYIYQMAIKNGVPKN